MSTNCQSFYFGRKLYNVHMKFKFVISCLTFRSVVPCSGETETYIFVHQIPWGLCRMKVGRATRKYIGINVWFSCGIRYHRMTIMWLSSPFHCRICSRRSCGTLRIQYKILRIWLLLFLLLKTFNVFCTIWLTIKYFKKYINNWLLWMLWEQFNVCIISPHGAKKEKEQRKI